MSKGKALALAITALLIGCLFLPAQIYGCFLPFLIIALFYGSVAWYKHHRDVRIIEQAEVEQLAVSAQMVLPPMTSKGSNGRLFVPPPLK